MSPSSESGPSLTEAMGMLMQALQKEADIFIKLVTVYSKGGPGWEEVRQTIERVHEQQQHERPGAEPASPPAPENDQSSGSGSSKA